MSPAMTQRWHSHTCRFCAVQSSQSGPLHRCTKNQLREQYLTTLRSCWPSCLRQMVSVHAAYQPHVVLRAVHACGVSIVQTEEGVQKYMQGAYYERASKLACALEKECGEQVVVVPPRGGMFLWVEFPAVEDSEDLVDLMTTHKARRRQPEQQNPFIVYQNMSLFNFVDRNTLRSCSKRAL
jgi:hypothetical protein